MSVGQAQRVLIAMAVMHRPALLIADEATSALDAAGIETLQALLADHLAQGGIAVIATHQDLALPVGSRRTLQLR